MKTIITLLLVLFTSYSWSQTNYGNPTNKPLPEKLQKLRKAIDVIQFPEENDPIKIGDTYYWKHATGILCKESAITITEYGAYIYYNDTWNLRKIYPLKELDKLFNTKKQKLLQGQPYIWANNWRTDGRMFGGWALWYFIGETKNGETVCGYKKLNTTNNLLN
jgi:hypothetical protein